MTKTMQKIMNDLNEQKELLKANWGKAEPEVIAVGKRDCDAAKRLEKMGLVTLIPWMQQITVKLCK